MSNNFQFHIGIFDYNKKIAIRLKKKNNLKLIEKRQSNSKTVGEFSV